MNTDSKAGLHSSWQEQTRSYRNSHLGADKARSYDQDLWDPGAAKGLEWLREERRLARNLGHTGARRLCSTAGFSFGRGRIPPIFNHPVPRPTGEEVSPQVLAIAR